MRVSKPCARPACPNLVTRETPRALAKARYCSVRCSTLHRIAQGWRPPKVPIEDCRTGGRRGGKAAAEVRRQLRAIALAERVETLIPPEFRAGLSERQQRLIKVLLSRAYHEGHRTGYNSGLHSRRGKWAPPSSED